MQHAFTYQYERRTNVLHTKVGVSLPPTTEAPTPTSKGYIAIWDTGATHSAVTKKVVEELGLVPTGLVEVRHAKGKSETNTYQVCIELPNKVRFQQVRVTEVDLIPDANQQDDAQPQLLIGMDIIGAGDFAVTCAEGRTVMSFRLPSTRKIDFIGEANMHNALELKKRKAPFRGPSHKKGKRR